MTVAEAGRHDGRLMEVAVEEGIDTDSPVILFDEKLGKINSDLTVGVDLASVSALTSNQGLSSRGMMLFGPGFIVSEFSSPTFGTWQTNWIRKLY